MFNAEIENGNIYKIEYANKTCIGVTEDVFLEMKNGLNKALNRNEDLAREKEEYYNLLVQHGIIKKPKDMDEKIKDLENTQNKILEALNDMRSILTINSKKMEELENELTTPNANGK